MRRYWVTIGDWCRWTLEYRAEVEAWCQANGLQMTIDTAPDAGDDDLHREAWGGRYIGSRYR